MDQSPVPMGPWLRDMLWGGPLLAQWGKDGAGPRCGESWECSAVSGAESTVLDGPMAGQSFSRYLGRMGTGFYGGAAPREFPLLVKLIGPRQWLSVQVHPADSREPGRGKDEAWLVLDAPPGAEIIYGHRGSAADLGRALARGRAEELLLPMKVKAGDCVVIPAGTVHALGPGILVYEVQQPRDVTYRLWDWGRAGEDGLPRPLQARQALEAMEEAGPGIVCGREWRTAGVRHCRYPVGTRFSLEQLWVEDGLAEPGVPYFTFWTVAEGQGRLTSPDRGFAVRCGQSFLCPAGSTWRFEGHARLLRAWEGMGPQKT